MIAYELVSDNLKQFMMDLGPNGDKRKITNWEIESWIMTKTGNNKLDNPVWHSLSENHKEYGITYDDSVFYAWVLLGALNTKKVPTRLPNILI
jgi:hypothetical protein